MLVLSTEALEKLSRAKKDENQNFISRLKNVSSKRFDELVHALAVHFTSVIDCTTCANCCRSVHVGVTAEEVQTLAATIGADPDSFGLGMVDMESDGQGGYMRTRPCIFLKNSMCSVYDKRPGSCRRYPGLQDSQLKYRIRRIMEEYTVCPIVYHTIEGAKKQLDTDSA